MMISSGLDVKMEALLAVLDGDIVHVQTVLKQLDQLRCLLIRRDNAGLEKLLVDLASEAETHAAHEQERQELRQELAVELQCRPEQLTLSSLLCMLPDAHRPDVAERQKTLRLLIGRLRREHVLTTMLLADCARFNQSLLRVFFGQNARGAFCYDASGAAVRRPDAKLMSIHF
jgi:hypothetical protein